MVDSIRFVKEPWFTALIENSTDILMLLNAEGRILYVSPSTSRILGYAMEEIIARSVFEFIHVDDLDLINQQFKEVNFVSIQYRFRHHNGSWVWLEGSEKNLLKQENIQAIVINGQDVTERKRIELQLKETARLKTEFTSTVSHELRTPIAISKEALSLVLRGKIGKITEDQEKIITMASDNIDRLGFLINDILDFSKIEAGRLDIKKEAIDIIPLLKENCAGWKLRADLKKIDLVFIAPEQPIILGVDQGRFLQILSNLLGNAVKFTLEGGKVKVIVDESDTAVKISILDTGIGIAVEDFPKLFKEFQQIRRTYGAGMRGTGLGLSITKGLVELHGGQLIFQSEFGKGSNFSFTIPKSLKT